ncbi:zinc finger protein 692 [Sceloporus undulatus]|uniref:zinc finger protein 692 n=1 Tax=Sceloporus undulatus TaxID=8520 RepID=UPI001C4AB2B6|nr:zinc finger protein 692 [Sceloporus undulatus]
MMEHMRQGCQRASETIRKQKRKELDARRGKCRIRIGSHLDQWCQLKEQLGFSLHSQLAKYLLDRYNSSSSVVKTGQDGSNTTPHPFPSNALQHLVVLSHNHSQECGFIPNMKSTLLDQKRVSDSMVWECLAGHTFSWKPSTPQTCTPPLCKVTSGGQDEEKEGKAVSSKPSPPPSPTIRRRRSLRRAAAAHAFSLALASNSPCPVDEAEPSSREDGEGSADRERTGCISPGSGTDLGKETVLLRGHSTEETAIPSEEIIPGGTKLPTPENTLAPLDGTPESLPDQQEEEEKAGGDEEGDEDDLAEEDNLAYADDLRDENYHPSLERDSKQRHHNLIKGSKVPPEEEQPTGETCLTSQDPSEEKSGEVSCKKWTQPSDEDVAQIGPKRIRKAAKREILLCDYDGCGKIFSNRQYLNHHKKYQHVHQKTFTCSDPSCGKSFNFKKHLKEHEKLHSDKRDYICEFCARSFRTSSNLIIHRRIHTGEKPLQCEICGFTCRQKASLNWHMKKHDADSFYQFSCDLCGKKFEKKDNVTAHKSKSHPETVTGPPQSVLGPPLAVEQLENSGHVQPSNTQEKTGHSPLAIRVIIE